MNRVRRPRRPRLRRLSAAKLIPNMTTVLALCAGMTAIRFGLQDRWELAIACIVVAAVLDGLDGGLARMLGGTSKFGAELDSLSDFLCFGVAPAIILYFWSLEGARGVGWAIALALAVSCSLRLARFNVSMDEEDAPAWASRYFTGVPAPAGAGLAILPVMLEFEIGNGVFREPTVVGPWTLAVALLMVSRIPTVSMKAFKIEHRYVMPTLLFVGLMAAFLASAPWLTLSVVGAFYLLSIPVSGYTYMTQRRRSEALAREKSEPASAELPSEASQPAKRHNKNGAGAEPPAPS